MIYLKASASDFRDSLLRAGCAEAWFACGITHAAAQPFALLCNTRNMIKADV
jgi:hypothetical protein